jgi:hypothetical protein
MNSNQQNPNLIATPEETTAQVFVVSLTAIASFLSLIVFLV